MRSKKMFRVTMFEVVGGFRCVIEDYGGRTPRKVASVHENPMEAFRAAEMQLPEPLTYIESADPARWEHDPG